MHGHRLGSVALMIGENGHRFQTAIARNFNTAMFGSTGSAQSVGRLGTVSMPPRVCGC